ncbi:MAG: hypothetical protein RLZ87_988, partial [Armatimonadota bacterium]
HLGDALPVAGFCNGLFFEEDVCFLNGLG